MLSRLAASGWLCVCCGWNDLPVAGILASYLACCLSYRRVTRRPSKRQGSAFSGGDIKLTQESRPSQSTQWKRVSGGCCVRPLSRSLLLTTKALWQFVLRQPMAHLYVIGSQTPGRMRMCCNIAHCVAVFWQAAVSSLVIMAFHQLNYNRLKVSPQRWLSRGASLSLIPVSQTELEASLAAVGTRSVWRPCVWETCNHSDCQAWLKPWCWGPVDDETACLHDKNQQCHVALILH